MNKPEAINYVWRKGTGLPAYAEEAVPDNAVLPYVTYQVMTDSLGYSVAPVGTIWDRSESWKNLDSLVARFENYIGTGITIPINDGYLFVCKGSPFAQRRVDPEDKAVRGYMITLQVEFLSN